MAEILPELAKLPILTEMKEDRGVLVERKNEITLRYIPYLFEVDFAV